MQVSIKYFMPQDIKKPEAEREKYMILYSRDIKEINQGPAIIEEGKTTRIIFCPPDYYTMFLDITDMPVIFIHKSSYFELRREMFKERKRNNDYSPLT
jgi:hypothetical protein